MPGAQSGPKAAGEKPDQVKTANEVYKTPLLDEIINNTESKRPLIERTSLRESALNLLRTPLTISKEGTLPASIEDLILRRMRAIEDTVSAQLDKIMHHKKFQALEADWRGLDQLVTNTRLAPDLKIKVLDVTRYEMERDLGIGAAKAKSYQDSELFKKIHDQEYNTPGGTPYSVLLGAFEFGNDERHIELLKQMAKIAAVSHAPFIAAVAPEMLGWQSHKEIQGGNALFKLMEGQGYGNWEALRKNPDSRYLGLVMPRYLARIPYSRNEDTPEFTYSENISEKKVRKFLWGNAAFVYGQVLTRAFAESGWCTAIRGPENGGDVELPLFSTGQHSPGVGPTEVTITYGQEKELYKMGFLPLVQEKGTPKAVFYSGQSVQLPTVYYEGEASESAQLSSRLPYIFAISRFAHHMKRMLYSKVGSPLGREALQEYLSSWIMKFVMSKPNASPDELARFPLADAKITVREIPGKAGEYDVEMMLQPHIQLEEIKVAMRLVSSVPENAVK